MKTLKIILGLALVVAFATQVKAQEKKVAVVGFYTDKIIGFDELGLGSERLLEEVLNLRDNPNFDLTPMLEKFHAEFFQNYSKEFPFQLLPESEVINDEAYKAFQPKFDMDEYDQKRHIIYPGYKYIYEGFAGKSNEENVAAIFKDKADGVMFVEIHFAFDKGFGIGGTASVKMSAYMRMALYDKTGKKVFALNEFANSKKTTMMVGGVPVMKMDKILPMCESAMEELMADLNKKLPKLIKKADKL